MSYLENLATATNKLMAVATDPHASQEDLKNALFQARVTLDHLLNDQGFQQDLQNLANMATADPDALRKITDTHDAFLGFFALEQKLLLDCGLDKNYVVGLTSEAETLRKIIRDTTVSRQAVLDGIAKVRDFLDRGTKNLDVQVADAELLMRGAQGMSGILIVGTNIKFFPAELAVPGGSLIASSAAGLWVIKDMVAEKPLVKRIVRFFFQALVKRVSIHS